MICGAWENCCMMSGCWPTRGPAAGSCASVGRTVDEGIGIRVGIDVTAGCRMAGCTVELDSVGFCPSGI